jgi:carbonic anhydrase
MEITTIINQLISGNKIFTTSHLENYFTALEEKQNPYITLVSCSDSRVPTNAIMPDTVNRVFTIQNIGNQILSTEGSIDYGIYNLQTPVLMIMGHSDCGAIKAYMNGFGNETFNIKQELDFLRPIINNHSSEEDFNKLLSLNIERNVDYQVNIAFKKYKDLVRNDKLVIVGAYYDFTNDFQKGKGRIIFVNVNKKKEVEEIVKTPFFTHLTPQEKQYFIGRI